MSSVNDLPPSLPYEIQKARRFLDSPGIKLPRKNNQKSSQKLAETIEGNDCDGCIHIFNFTIGTPTNPIIFYVD